MAWDLSRATYDNKKFQQSVAPAFPAYGLYFALAGPWSGKKWWTTDRGIDTVRQYRFSDWDIETTVFDRLFSVTDQTHVPQDMNLSYDGSKMYLIDGIFGKVFQYALSTPWDIDSASYNNKYFQLTHGTHANVLRFNLDESKMYVFESAEGIIYQYTLATPGDVETAVYSGYSLDLSEVVTYITAMCFSLDGTKLFVGQYDESGPVMSIRQYSLSTAWRISTATLDMTFDVSAQTEWSVRGLAFSSDGDRMYVLGGLYDISWKSNVFQYLLVFIPEGTTQALTNIGWNTATGNGNITDDGGGPVTLRGFCRIEGTEGDPTDTDYTYWETGSFGTGAYSITLTPLSAGTYYRVRAYFKTSAGTGYGDTVQLLTLPYLPGYVRATDGVHTDKVVITWNKMTGATGYQVYRDGVALGWLGDVDTYDDTGASAPTITPGTASASDGVYVAYVTLSLSGQSVDGTIHVYKVKARNATGESDYSATNTGYRGGGSLTYQWRKSAGNSDASYLSIFGATTIPYNDIYAPLNGDGRYYRCVLNATGATQQISTADRGYRKDISGGVGEYSNPVVPIIPITTIEPTELLPGEPLVTTYPPFIWEPPAIDSQPPWDVYLPEIPPWVYWDFPELPPSPPWVLPDLSSWEYPDYPSMSFVNDFYYRKPYTKRDLDELRKKCIIFNKNSVELALVLRHNTNVLREYFNELSDNIEGRDEFNRFKDLIPTQHLKELYLDPLELNNFKDIINSFIVNSADNNMNVNHNFNLIQEGLRDYETESDDAYFREINTNVKSVTEDNPDVHRLKNKIDELNNESTTNFTTIMHNLKIIKARLL